MGHALEPSHDFPPFPRHVKAPARTASEVPPSNGWGRTAHVRDRGPLEAKVGLIQWGVHFKKTKIKGKSVVVSKITQDICFRRTWFFVAAPLSFSFAYFERLRSKAETFKEMFASAKAMNKRIRRHIAFSCAG